MSLRQEIVDGGSSGTDGRSIIQADAASQERSTPDRITCQNGCQLRPGLATALDGPQHLQHRHDRDIASQQTIGARKGTGDVVGDAIGIKKVELCRRVAPSQACELVGSRLALCRGHVRITSRFVDIPGVERALIQRRPQHCRARARDEAPVELRRIRHPYAHRIRRQRESGRRQRLRKGGKGHRRCRDKPGRDKTIRHPRHQERAS